MGKKFDYQGALEAGYAPDEVLNFLSENNPKFDVQAATQAGYSPEEISGFLSNNPKEEKGIIEKGARIAGQFALGAAESAALPYDLAVSGYANEGHQIELSKQNIRDDIDFIQEKKMFGNASPKDLEDLKELKELLKNPEALKKTVQTHDVSVRGLAEKATGLDLEPEGFLEKAANITGFIKDPRKIASVAKFGITPKEVIKSILPNSKEIIRGAGITSGLEIAEDGGYGPIGSMGAMIAGDLAASGISGALKGAKNLVTKPKETLAKAAAKLLPAEKKEIQKDLIKSFKETGIQPDLGTITDSNLIRMAQARVAQSGLTGKALDDFKKNMIDEIKGSYENLAKQLSESKFATEFEAGTISKNAIKNIRDKELSEIREIYKGARSSVKEKAFVDPKRISDTITRLEKELAPGQLKSVEQKKVLEVVDNLKRDVLSSDGKIMYAKPQDLMNNKIALNDIINYEVQGGTKQLLKQLVGDIDRVLISHGKENPSFAKNYINANKRFAEHAKTFRNKDISRLLMEEDPVKLLNRMNTIQGMKNIEKILNKSQEGKEIYDKLKRQKLDQMFSKSFVNNSEEQLKFGTFTNALEGGKNSEIAKEILGKQSYEKLKKIQKNVGLLQQSAQKFFNASQSGTVAADAAILTKLIWDFTNLISGNPWPLVKFGATLGGAKKLSQLVADPEFLKLVEDVITKSKTKNQKDLFESILKLKPYAKEFGSNPSEN